MAGPPTLADGQVTVVFGGSAVPTGAVCTIGLQNTLGEFPSNALNTIAPLIEAFHGKAAVNTCSISRFELKIGPEATGPTYTQASVKAGEGVSQGVAPNTATLIRKELFGLSGRFAGRMYWPATPEDQVGVDGLVGGAYLSIVQTAADTLLSSLTTAGYEPAVFSSSVLIPPVQMVERFSVQSRVATQRRRLRR